MPGSFRHCSAAGRTTSRGECVCDGPRALFLVVLLPGSFRHCSAAGRTDSRGECVCEGCRNCVRSSTVVMVVSPVVVLSGSCWPVLPNVSVSAAAVPHP